MKNKDYDHFSDEHLVEKIITGDQPDLFKILFERYHRRVHEKCNSLVKSNELASELTQDILSKAFEKLSSFKGNSSFGSWLYSITYNHCIDYLRLKKKLHYPDWNQQHELPIIDEAEEDKTELHSERLEKLMNLLHTEEKAMLLMKYRDDFSLKQIAEAMRLTEGAVKMRMKRSKARLLYLYKSLYGDFS